MMKGVVLAGGLGTRLYPLTKITNKHLLPIYHRPMIYYPVQTLVQAGLKDIMIVTGGNNAGDFLRLLGNGNEFGLKEISYAYQEGEGGIAQALGLTEHFVGRDKMMVILGDNIIKANIAPFVHKFQRQKRGAKIILKEVPDPQRFGVPVFRQDRIMKIEEKPKIPRSRYAVIGIYMYDHHVFDIIKTLRPSRRGELEITDVNNAYLRKGLLTYDIIEGWWSDAGTFDSLLRANQLMAQEVKHASRRK
jgi:glucose-1-phosphate thymidylyltransferase